MTMPINYFTISIAASVISAILISICLKHDKQGRKSPKLFVTTVVFAAASFIMIIYSPIIYLDQNRQNKIEKSHQETLGPQWYKVYKIIASTRLCASRSIIIRETKNYDMPPLSIKAFELIGTLIDHSHYDNFASINHLHDEDWTILKSYIKALPNLNP